MKINFVRAGGIAGIRLRLEIDTQSLPAGEASQLARLVESARFFDLDQATIDAPAAPDRFNFRLSIESETGARRALAFPEASVTDDLRPLVEYLTALARRGGRGKATAAQRPAD